MSSENKSKDPTNPPDTREDREGPGDAEKTTSNTENPSADTPGDNNEGGAAADARTRQERFKALQARAVRICLYPI